MTTYKGYKIKAVNYRGCRCYKVVTPVGITWLVIAMDLKTVRKWIDTELTAEFTKLKR